MQRRAVYTNQSRKRRIASCLFPTVWNGSRNLPKSAMFKTMGYSPLRLFGQNRPISDPSEFTRNLPQRFRKKLEMHLQAHGKRSREFGTIPDTYPNPPCSKPWAVAQAFWSKSADFGHFGIHPKSSPPISKVVGNPFGSTYEAFEGVWNDSRHLPKSAIFKTMGYSPGFLVKIGRFRTLRKSPEIFTNHVESSWKSICKHIGVVSGSLERFPKRTQIRHVQSHGL